MKVARSEMTITFDVDDTLIFWDNRLNKPHNGSLSIVCPHDNRKTFHRVHKRHVDFLKKQHAKGYTVIVWSASGTGWAEAVVNALGISDYVDFVMSKPHKWVDDIIDPSQVLGTHIYLDEAGYSI